MDDQNKAILKALVTVAWADGVFAEEEKQVLEALLDAFEASPEEAEELRAYASTPRTADDIPVTDLSYDDRRVLLQHAVFLSFVDGDQSDPEVKLIDKMVQKLRIPSEEATALRDVATARAKRYINAL
ncbi:MAG: TerB family tellurite resistance protein [Polyangiaceae bacterium]|nr:TerB family tellurite resistance protein [Polyangiaceae bacterium]